MRRGFLMVLCCLAFGAIFLFWLFWRVRFGKVCVKFLVLSDCLIWVVRLHEFFLVFLDGPDGGVVLL